MYCHNKFTHFVGLVFFFQLRGIHVFTNTTDGLLFAFGKRYKKSKISGRDFLITSILDSKASLGQVHCYDTIIEQLGFSDQPNT